MRARLLAHYLPQFHPIPENDEWWGKGFTEWTNVAKAKPLFKGHWQPRLPADLGFYDLRVPEVREAQADMAREYGIEGFIYYHYWFGNGRRILERPFDEVVASKSPDFPFCLCWANHTWSGVWYGESDRVLVEQKYPGVQDIKNHFETLLPAFNDSRYVRVDGKPLFHVLFPHLLPNVTEFTDTFREMAHTSGLGGVFLVGGAEDSDHSNYDFDMPLSNAFHNSSKELVKRNLGARLINSSRLGDSSTLIRKVLKSQVSVVEYKDLIARMDLAPYNGDEFIPVVLPNWDNTPRSGARGLVVRNSTPELFAKHLENAVCFVQNFESEQHRLVFIKSWNEWAEGNYLEPDVRYGLDYLKAVRAVVDK